MRSLAAAAAQVACTLLTEAVIASRVALLKKILRLGECFIELRNFDGAFAVWLGLNVASVSRLKSTWKALDKSIEVRLGERRGRAGLCAGLSGRGAQAFERLGAFCRHEHNYREYRALLRTAEPPALPYMAIYTLDLTHIEDGNDDRVSEAMINFEKMHMIARVSRAARRWRR